MEIHNLKKPHEIGARSQTSYNFTYSGNQRICREDIIVIDELLDHFSEYTANELVEITHNQDPWLMHYRPNRNAVIPKKSIKEYFEKQKQI